MAGTPKLKSKDVIAPGPGAYQITDNDDNVVYVGSTNNLPHRLRQHNSSLMRGVHKNKKLQAISEDVVLNFVAQPTSTKEEALAIEQKQLDTLHGSPDLCNVSKDASDGFNGSRNHGKGGGRGFHGPRGPKGPMSEETKMKISESLKSSSAVQAAAKERGAKISAAKTGKKMSEETKLKIAESNRGKIVSAETRLKMSEAQQRRRQST